MCKNHSHLIARFDGRDPMGREGVLTFLLENDQLLIEGPGPRGYKMTIPTTGVLLVPSTVLGGYVAALPPATEARRIYLCLLPGDATIIMPPQPTDSGNFAEQSEITWIVGESFPTRETGTTVDEAMPDF